MNWSSVILAGTVAITAFWWVVHAFKHYPGPKVMDLYIATDGAASVIAEKDRAGTIATEVEAPVVT
ncbi:choline transporter [Colletotrichum tofieldiae]|nr:choline transporter [Colletotrichum tofieldiae]